MSLEKWKKNSAEDEMKEAGKKMMEEAAKRKAKMKVIGKYTITVSGNNDYTKEELEEIMGKIIDFSKNCDAQVPNIELSIDPVIED